MSSRRFALVAGGGTAGHLQPALAIAEALVDRGYSRQDIEFVASRRGEDGAALTGRGFPVSLLPGRGIARSFRPAMVVRNVGAVAGLTVATAQAIWLVLRRRPSVVVSVGGYASVATAFAAVLAGIPLVLVNVDAVPGAANRLFSPFAKACAVAWEDTPLPRTIVTGTPVRPQIARTARTATDRQIARRQLGVEPARSTVVVFGGSLGARRINDAVDGLARCWSDRSDRTIYHIVGRRDWNPDEPPGSVREDGLELVRVAYEDRMHIAYAAADVVVCRAGAMSVAELAIAGVPAVLVPLPGAPGDHQTANARRLEQAAGAVVLPDVECDGARLAIVLDRMLDDSVALEVMAEAAALVGRPDAAAAAARVVESQGRRSELVGTPA